MYYEALIKLTDANGKSTYHRVLVRNASTFAETEYAALQYAANRGASSDILSVRRTRIYEFANEDRRDNDLIYLANLTTIFTDPDTGKTKRLHYPVGIYARNMDEAKDTLSRYTKQGLSDFTTTSIKETSYEAVIEIA